MTNHEVTLLWMANILARLGEAWPARISLTLQGTLDATDAHPTIPPQKLWCDLWLWLLEERLVRIKPENEAQLSGFRRSVGQYIDLAVLTAKGLDTLRNAPGPKTDEVSLGHSSE